MLAGCDARTKPVAIYYSEAPLAMGAVVGQMSTLSYSIQLYTG